MKYKESSIILEKIKRAKKILINCHKDPDPDGVGSALALYGILKELGRDASVVCPTSFSKTLKFLPYYDQIQRVDFSKFDFSAFDLFITVDSPEWGFVVPQKIRVDIPIVCIDHHKTNKGFGQINLIDAKIGSCAELLYLIFSDWEAQIGKHTATNLLTGIIGDTGVFRHSGATTQTLRIAAELMDKGASKDKILISLYGSFDIPVFKFWAQLLHKMQVDKPFNFVWAAIPYDEYKKYENSDVNKAKSAAATLFFRGVKDTNFGILMVETQDQFLEVHLRARTDFDVSIVAEELGGGGHQRASGAEVKGLPFDQAVDKVLEAARKFAK